MSLSLWLLELDTNKSLNLSLYTAGVLVAGPAAAAGPSAALSWPRSPGPPPPSQVRLSANQRALLAANVTNQKPLFSHPMSAIPGGELCLAETGDTETQLRTFLTSVAILGYCLPLALIICLVIGQ